MNRERFTPLPSESNKRAWVCSTILRSVIRCTESVECLVMNCRENIIYRDHEQLCAMEEETSLTLVSKVDSNNRSSSSYRAGAIGLDIAERKIDRIRRHRLSHRIFSEKSVAWIDEKEVPRRFDIIVTLSPRKADDCKYFIKLIKDLKSSSSNMKQCSQTDSISSLSNSANCTRLYPVDRRKKQRTHIIRLGFVVLLALGFNEIRDQSEASSFERWRWFSFHYDWGRIDK